jgi:hypothetical protein
MWKNYHKQLFAVKVRTSVLRDRGISRVDTENPIGFGGYWSVYPVNSSKVLKINVVSDAKVDKMEHKEELVYPIAARHGAGPKIYDWFRLTEPDVEVFRISEKGAESARSKKIHYVSFAVVERFTKHVDSAVKRMKGYKKMEGEMEERVSRVEEDHGIILDDMKGENYFVNISENKITKFVAGDWGSTRLRKDNSLVCHHHH